MFTFNFNIVGSKAKMRPKIKHVCLEREGCLYLREIKDTKQEHDIHLRLGITYASIFNQSQSYPSTKLRR